MLKSIKIKQEVYDELERLADKRETYGEVIMRLIKAYKKLMEIQ
jgi:predicted CopG family antitoxin